MTLNQKQKNDHKEIEKISQEVGAIEALLSNETVGAKEFNDILHRFIGRSELCLSFNQKKKGYEIIRNGVGEHDGNLSEGEKTAIAFVYFITKLKENGNNIKDTIVVVDDPVSSFDSNHLFHAYSFLRTQCTEAKQLFCADPQFHLLQASERLVHWSEQKQDQQGKNGELLLLSAGCSTWLTPPFIAC